MLGSFYFLINLQLVKGEEKQQLQLHERNCRVQISASRSLLSQIPEINDFGIKKMYRHGI